MAKLNITRDFPQWFRQKLIDLSSAVSRLASRYGNSPQIQPFIEDLEGKVLGGFQKSLATLQQPDVSPYKLIDELKAQTQLCAISTKSVENYAKSHGIRPETWLTRHWKTLGIALLIAGIVTGLFVW